MCINASSYICVCVRVLLGVCVLLVMEGVGELTVLWTDGEAHLYVRVFSILFQEAAWFVCLCVRVCVACLHTPHLDRNSQMSFACGRWDPLEKLDTHRTKITYSELAPSLLSHTSSSTFRLGFS